MWRLEVAYCIGCVPDFRDLFYVILANGEAAVGRLCFCWIGLVSKVSTSLSEDWIALSVDCQVTDAENFSERETPSHTTTESF